MHVMGYGSESVHCWSSKDMQASVNWSVDEDGTSWQNDDYHGSSWGSEFGSISRAQYEKCPFLDGWDSQGSVHGDQGSPSAGWSDASKSVGLGGLIHEPLGDRKEGALPETFRTPFFKGLQLDSDFAMRGLRHEDSADQSFTIGSMEVDHISSLPDDIVEKILSMLPLLSLFRSTAVCQRWRSLINSESFIAACALSCAHEPWYLMYRDSEHCLGAAYDPTSKKWHQYALPFFDPLASFAASANGLACFMDRRNCDVIYICNPMTKKWRTLPQPSSPWISDYCAVDMVVDREQNQCYKVVVARSTPVPGDFTQWELSIEIYDSALDCWSTANTKLLQGWRAGEECKICNGVLYSVTHSTVTVGHEDSRHGLIAYDLSLAEFREILSMPCSLSCARLVTCGNSLIMVGGIGTYDFIKGVGIWKRTDREWKQIGKMPTKLFHGFAGGLDDVFSCGGHGDLIYLHSYGSPQLMVYDVASGSWSWAKPCPVLKRDPLHLFTGFCFEPRLNVTV